MPESLQSLLQIQSAKKVFVPFSYVENGTNKRVTGNHARTVDAEKEFREKHSQKPFTDGYYYLCEKRNRAYANIKKYWLITNGEIYQEYPE